MCQLFAAKHPWFRRALVGRAGRAYRRAEFGFKMWMLRLGRPPRAPPLSDAEATQVGADIIGRTRLSTAHAPVTASYDYSPCSYMFHSLFRLYWCIPYELLPKTFCL